MKINKGQSISEYLIVIGLVIAAAIAMQTYVKRNIQGKTENGVFVSVYNPNYGDNKMCICGHTYSKHFDKYESMKPIMCKFCECIKFKQSSKKE